MLTVFAAILPIFLLILFGQACAGCRCFRSEFWRGLDVMGFYVLYPALLFVTIVRADFSALSFDAIMIALAMPPVSRSQSLTLAAWPLLRSAASD
jgi:malonate transporter